MDGIAGLFICQERMCIIVKLIELIAISDLRSNSEKIMRRLGNQ